MCAGVSGNLTHTATEMMFGSGARFSYLECGTCGTLTLQDVPPSLERFYPPEYYSFGGDGWSEPLGPVRGDAFRRSFFGVALRTRSVARAMVGAADRLHRRSARWVALLAGLGLRWDAAVLDVGCGSGHRLRTLQRWGFGNLSGSDPFLPQGSTIGPGIRFLTQRPQELPGRYDLVMFHHSFEHLPDAPEVLPAVRRRLSPRGHVLLRLPLAGTFAWREYATSWVQLDAPRHTFVFSRGAIEQLAAQAGLRIRAVVYDSDSFQFWGSEQYARGIGLTHPSSYAVNPAASPFSQDDIRDYERRARRLNAIGDGDQAAFLLARA